MLIKGDLIGYMSTIYTPSTVNTTCSTMYAH